jgi:methionyl-tRNA synthetase
MDYDLFTSTQTQNHWNVSQKMFLALKKNGFLYKESQSSGIRPNRKNSCPTAMWRAPATFADTPMPAAISAINAVTCSTLNRLIDPRSKIDGSTPELRETEHYFLDLSRLQDLVVEFLKVRESYWRPNVMRQSLGQIVADNLHGRAITRDLTWGIPLPEEILAEGKEWEEQAPLCLVRGGHRLPFSRHRMEPAQRRSGSLAQVVAGP